MSTKFILEQSIPIHILRTTFEMQRYAAGLKANGFRIGLVPTMGALHEGHLSLVRLLDEECDVKAASIFVNPTQFGPSEDFGRYPRNEAHDLKLLESVGCSLVFCPEPSEIYPDGFQTYVEVEELNKHLCGRFRPGHFRGVATVVLKLFNITKCDVAAFGLKDYQQAVLIRRMVRDLNLPVRILFGETLREPDGLAMSSRNAYLTGAGRTSARAIPKALELGRQIILAGERDASKVVAAVKNRLEESGGIEIQYIEVVDPMTLLSLVQIEGPVQIALAAFSGKTRLIDNIGVELNATET